MTTKDSCHWKVYADSFESEAPTAAVHLTSFCSCLRRSVWPECLREVLDGRNVSTDRVESIVRAVFSHSRYANSCGFVNASDIAYIVREHTLRGTSSCAL